MRLSCETNSFPFSWESDIDENGSLNYHTTHKNYQNLLQKWWWWVDGNFLNSIFFSGEARFTLGGYGYKQNCHGWGSENSQDIEQRPLYPEKVTVWCALWSEGVIGWYTAHMFQKVVPQKNQCLQRFAWRSFKRCSVSHIISTFKLYNKKLNIMKNIFYMCFIYIYYWNHEMDNPIFSKLYWNLSSHEHKI